MLATTKTKLTEPEQLVVDSYDVLARNNSCTDPEIWVDAFMFKAFCRLPRRNKVIDVGCGSGRRFLPLLDTLGIQIQGYIGVDPSVGQLALARATYPEFASKFWEGSIYTLADMFPEEFDGFLLTAVLMHVPRTRLLEALRSLRKCLKTGAVGFFTTPEGRGEIVNDYGVYITLYTQDELITTFKQAELQVTKADVSNGSVRMVNGCISAR